MTQMDKPVMQYSTRLLKAASIGRGLLAALLLLLPTWCGTAYAFGILGIPGVYMPQTYLKIGAAYTRAIVPGPSGRPVYVEFNTSGKEAAEIGEATGPLERAKVMPAGTYRAYLQRLSDARQRYPDSQVMKAAEYRSKTFKTVTGETIKKPSISTTILTVLVRADEQLFSTDGKDLLLLELPIKHDVQPSSSSQALLLSEQGDILHQTANTIGYRVGFHGKDGKVNENLGRDRESQIYGPLAGVPIQLWYGGGTITAQDGKYVMPYVLPPCPGFTFEYTTDAYLELYYKRFNPRGKSYMPYYMVRQDWDYCFGLEVYSWAVMGIKATIATPAEPNIDFPLDLMVLDGAATVKGAKLGAKTEYSAETGERDHYLQQKYDFDGDEKPDWVVPGKKVKKEIEGKEREVFVTTSLEEAELQGIYLSSRYESVPANTEETGPDFTRLIDTTPDFQDRALLETISEDDLRDTDIYVFRESNGQMIAERRGLHESELYKNYSGVDSEEGSFRFTIHLRGEKEGIFGLSGIDQGGKEFTKWQSAGGFKEEFQKRNANHLKPGEMVRIIAINRPTGYMGSVRYQLESADVSSGLMGFTGQRIQMSPPNLKVWAERKNKIEQGMTKGEEKKQLIGNEGAGLGSDISIAIYTDWIDADGTPLPEELADYGYTGRLAKIVAANQLAPVGANSLSQFQIKPGQHVQVIQLPEKVLAKQHLYLQVAGQPSNRNPDFSSGGGSGILQYRPSKFVPVMVPLHDEEASELARQAYRKADEKPELNLKKPEPMYAWQYRPELQFSLYELNVEEIRRVDFDGEAEGILKVKDPTLTSSDKYIDFMYGLLASAFDTLASWETSGKRDMVIALGQEEIKLSIGASGNVRFENLDHIANIDSEDFLSIRLYANNDMGNLLWEYAFEFLALDSTDSSPGRWNDKNFELSADDPQIGLQAWLLGYQERESKGPYPESIWELQGSGYLEKPGVVAGNLAGYFENKLFMPVTAGAQTTVYVREKGTDTKVAFGVVKVVPGEVSRIDLASEGELHVFEVGSTTYTATLKDRNGNLVSDGTPVQWDVSGNAFFESAEVITTGGRAVAVLKGGGGAGVLNITAASGRVQASSEQNLLPLNIAVETLSRVNAGQLFDVSVTVKDTSGKPVRNVFGLPTSSVGRVLKRSTVTDAQGVLTFSVQAPQRTMDGAVGIVIGEQRESELVHVQVNQDRPSVMQPTLLVGDQHDAGTISAGWVNDFNVDIPYETSKEVRLRGNANEVITVSVGSVGIPAIAPVFSYPMTRIYEDGVAPDAYGNSPGKAFFIDVVQDSPYGVGASYSFRKEAFKDPQDGREFQSSMLEAEVDGAALLPGNFAFRVDAKILKSGGELFRWGSGQSLTVDDERKVIYRVNTESGERVVTSAPLEFGRWYNITGSYQDGRIKLSVNDALGVRELSQAEISGGGSVVHSDAADPLQIGRGLEGFMRGFEFFDLTRSPLLELESGQVTSSVTLDDEGQASMVIRSTGRLAEGMAAEAKSSFLRQLPIRIERSSRPGDVDISYVSLVTEEGYQQIVSAYTTSAPLPERALEARRYALQTENLYALRSFGQLPFPYAQAGFFDWVPSADELANMAKKGIEYAAEAATWVVPYDDVITIAEQLEYLANDHPDYNPMLLAASSLSVLSAIPTPFTKALKVIMKPIKALAKIIGKGKFGKAFGKKFLALAKDCFDSNGKGLACNTLQSMMPFLEAVGYMYLADPQAFEEMLASLESEDDFIAMFEFMTLGIEPEWLGLDEPNVTQNIFPGNNLPLLLGVPVAYAKDPADKVKGFGQKLLVMFKKLKAEGVISKDVSLFAIFKPFVQLKPWLKEGNKTEILKRIVHVKFLRMIAVTASRKSAGVVVGIVKGYTGQRLPQPVVWGMLYYLLVEQRPQQGNPKAFSEEVYAKIWVKVGMAFLDVGQFNTQKTLCPIDPKNLERETITPGQLISKLSQANGALFHLSQVALLSLEGEDIQNIEKAEVVQLYTERVGTKVPLKVGGYKRDVDIVTAKFMAETKSLSIVTTKGNWKSNYFGAWVKVDAKGTSLMRQFMLDRVMVGKENPAEKLRWYFDPFKNKATTKCGQFVGGLYQERDVAEARKLMKKLPSWFDDKESQATIGISKKDMESKYNDGAMDAVVLNEGFMDKAFNKLVERGSSFVTSGEIDSIMAQF
jgi:hypothetical protein